MKTESVPQTRFAFCQAGFTLIELMTSITIMSILSTIGIASFVSYSRIQLLSNATQDVATSLQLAKASAVSQVKPITCIGTLIGYQVTTNTVPDPTTGLESFAIAPVCDTEDNPDLAAQKITFLPKNVVFGASSSSKVLFHTVTGDVTITPSGTSIVLKYQGANDLNTIQKTITVETDGRIHVR
jgi:prepilin-type N-terminal cleavage/methylation domain-containing protein